MTPSPSRNLLFSLAVRLTTVFLFLLSSGLALQPKLPVESVITTTLT